MEEACEEEERNSEESDYSSINVHNARHNNNCGNWRKQKQRKKSAGEGVRHRGKLVKHVYGNAPAVAKQ